MTDIKKHQSKIKVDQARCGGHARCMEEAPKVFGYDSRTNKAYVLESADISASKAEIDRAILACPECAIRRVRADSGNE